MLARGRSGSVAVGGAAPPPTLATMPAATAAALSNLRPPARSRRRDGGHVAAAPALLTSQKQNHPARRRPTVAVAASAPADDPTSTETSAKSGEYSKDMQAKMGTTLTYRHELGINWDRITPDLIVGSCLQTPEDVDRLAEEAGVTTVFCLQEDCDLDYFNIDIKAIAERCDQRGDIRHVRFPIRDFDPFELRRLLPRAVARLAQAHRPRPASPALRGKGDSSPQPHPATLPPTGSVYIHCTAGMGRAPATALAYLTWLRGWDLDEAYSHLRANRACSPKIEAVRSATTDLLLGCEPLPVTVSLPRRGTVTDARVAGLDVGWGTQLPLEFNPRTGRLETTRRLLPGRYPFKFVLDGRWAASHDYPTIQDGDNLNNVLEVLPRDEVGGVERAAQRDRLSTVGGKLTEEERMELAALLCPWATHRKTDHLTPLDG
jgi:hypothetical protein